jgi:hypothetical protein
VSEVDPPTIKLEEASISMVYNNVSDDDPPSRYGNPDYVHIELE